LALIAVPVLVAFEKMSLQASIQGPERFIQLMELMVNESRY
jgi:hypothetical protein